MNNTLKISTLLTGLALSLPAHAATPIHYWSFDDTNDSVGGLVGTDSAGANYALGSTYGQARAGSGNALETQLAGKTFTAGSAQDVNLSGNFSVSYWYFDDNTDGNAKGVSAFDMLLSANDAGMHVTTNAAGLFNMRLDDEAGNFIASVQAGSASEIVRNAWTHVSINVDRVNNSLDVYSNGTLQESVDISAITGSIISSQAIEIGAVNGQVQQGAIDDLAIYTSLLSEDDITNLASGTHNPTSIPEPASLLMLTLGSLCITKRKIS